MKVYIGPYTNWVGPYQICDFLFKPWLGEKRSDAIAKWLNEQTPVGRLLEAMYDRKERKIKIKLHDYDSWSADDTLAHIIYPLLLKVKENKHGSPFVDNKDVPKELRRPENLEPHETDEHFHARWEYVIDEMIFAFGTIVNDDNPKFSSGTIEMVTVGYDKDGNRTDNEDDVAWYSYEHGPNHTYKIDRIALNKWEKRRQNGFALFGKYYQSLWT